jgi:hypothetical protein
MRFRSQTKGDVDRGLLLAHHYHIMKCTGRIVDCGSLIVVTAGVHVCFIHPSIRAGPPFFEMEFFLRHLVLVVLFLRPRAVVGRCCRFSTIPNVGQNMEEDVGREEDSAGGTTAFDLTAGTTTPGRRPFGVDGVGRRAVFLGGIASSIIIGVGKVPRSGGESRGRFLSSPRVSSFPRNAVGRLGPLRRPRLLRRPRGAASARPVGPAPDVVGRAWRCLIDQKGENKSPFVAQVTETPRWPLHRFDGPPFDRASTTRVLRRLDTEARPGSCFGNMAGAKSPNYRDMVLLIGVCRTGLLWGYK